jgi:hydroxymethylpyrimidine pyrophosphatase-like HAD family hydrolase
MRYLALACDYDGTLAHSGAVSEETISALTYLRSSGRKLLLVTGRRLDDLQRIFPRLDLFDRVVVENGALLYRPETREEVPLSEPPPEPLVAALRAAGVAPLAVGRTIVATFTPHEATVLEAIRALGLEQQVIFNKGAVMVLPSGVNKATGLRAALLELGLSERNVVGVGDAENDHAFLSACECGVAVANALPLLKERADLVTAGDHGTGVVELVTRLVESDLADVPLPRHQLVVGARQDGAPVTLDPYGSNVLLAGTSGSGKSTFATSLLERLQEGGRQFCVVDPEGDYPVLPGAVVLGGPDGVPTAEEVLDVLARPDQSAVVSLLGLKIEQRPPFFERLLSRLLELRARSGRPHWIVIDEAHHLLPASWDQAPGLVPQDPHGLLLITVHPNKIAEPALDAVDVVFAIGHAWGDTLRGFAEAVETPEPPVRSGDLETGQVAAWWRRTSEPPFLFRADPPRSERKRHVRKYAAGELRPDKSFYFRGAEGKLNLRAQNLQVFLQLADGVDDGTWLHHLTRGDYSRWFREAIRDEALAENVGGIERSSTDPAESRRLVRAQIEERYTMPA